MFFNGIGSHRAWTSVYDSRRFSTLPVRFSDAPGVKPGRLCKKASDLASWRNPRIHPRVRLDENGISIYDAKTLKPLTIGRDECVEKIQEAIAIGVNLDLNTQELVTHLTSQAEISRWLKEIFERVEENAQ